MGIIDRVIAAVTPPESDEARLEAHAKARSLATRGDWLDLVLDHHERIDAAFADVRAQTDADSRRAAQKRLATILTGHSLAEDGVLYPALSDAGEKGHATTAYTEQSAAKMQLGMLEHLDPMSQDYLDKFGHLEGAVKHHVYAEESNWFVDLKEKLPDDTQQYLTLRYKEEFSRYMGADA